MRTLSLLALIALHGSFANFFSSLKINFEIIRDHKLFPLQMNYDLRIN